MGYKYTYIQNQKCPVFKNEKHAGRMVEASDGTKCCNGALTDPTDWADICPECWECDRYIQVYENKLETQHGR